MSAKNNEFLVIGHKGASSIAPENTLKAFKKAIELNANCIEFDVHETKDGKIVITHDEDILRITGKEGFIKDLTLLELKKYDFGEGEEIPTFEELIELTKGKIILNCEIKVVGITDKIVEILETHDIRDETIVSCFNHDELLKIQKLDPNVKLAALGPIKRGWTRNPSSRKKLIKVSSDNQFYAINPHHSIVNKKFVKSAHKRNIKIFPWTINSPNEIKRLLDLKVDGIITDDISTLQEIVKNYEI